MDINGTVDFNGYGLSGMWIDMWWFDNDHVNISQIWSDIYYLFPGYVFIISYASKYSYFSMMSAYTFILKFLKCAYCRVILPIL